uniref:Protein kinase domain-containing protein n=1 Tax=Anopheles epiroticus TaxID=199890 RepID=A0A182PN39_9DIPT
MGNADIRTTEPDIVELAGPPEEAAQSRTERRKKTLVVSFQLPSPTDGTARFVLLGRWYRETLAHRRCIVWLQSSLSRVPHVLRCIPSRQPTRRLRPRPPVVRISRRRWLETTLNSETQLLKSCWPVPESERLFLPTFPIDEQRAKRYVERTHVANGAFGRVYRVRDARDAAGERWYALKLLQKSNIVQSGAVGQVRDEVKIQTVCGHHPFIVPCVDYWQNLSEFYGNGELFHRLKSFTVQLVQLYVAELALAI